MTNARCWLPTNDWATCAPTFSGSRCPSVFRASVFRGHVDGEAAELGFHLVGCLLGLTSVDSGEDSVMVGSQTVTDVGPTFLSGLCHRGHAGEASHPHPLPDRAGHTRTQAVDARV